MPWPRSASSSISRLSSTTSAPSACALIPSSRLFTPTIDETPCTPCLLEYAVVAISPTSIPAAQKSARMPCGNAHYIQEIVQGCRAHLLATAHAQKSGQKGNRRHACGRACSRPLAMSDWKPGIASEMPTARLMAKKGTPPPIMASTSVLFTTCRRACSCSQRHA